MLIHCLCLVFSVYFLVISRVGDSIDRIVDVFQIAIRFGSRSKFRRCEPYLALGVPTQVYKANFSQFGVFRIAIYSSISYKLKHT